MVKLALLQGIDAVYIPIKAETIEETIEFAEETGIGWTVVGYGPCEPWAIRIG